MEEKIQNQLNERILAEADNSRLPCQKAFAIAEETGLETADVGKACNKLEVKIVECQLGCF